MKLFMGILLAVALTVTAFYAVATHFKEHKLKRLIRIILSIAILIIFNYEIVLFLKNEQWNLFAHSVYFIATDWMLYYMLQFSIEYSGSDFDQFVKRRLMILLLAADSISLLFNTKFCHLFRLYPVTRYHGDYFYAMETTPFFYVHYFIIIMLVTFCLLSLFHRAFHMPRFYRTKYLTIAIIMVLIIAANIISFKQAIDFSIIGYAIEGIALYHCVLVFTPQRLLQKTLLLVSQDMPVGLIMLDIDGAVLYSNCFARELLNTASPLMDKHGRQFAEWCRDQYFSKQEAAAQDYTFYRHAEKTVLNIQFRLLKDAKNKLQGGYFTIYNRTEEIARMQEERFLATHDSLTGLYNKSHFCKEAREYILDHPEETLLIVCTNIKDFKMINDLFGDKVGDLILKSCADMIRSNENRAIVYSRLSNDVFAFLVRKTDFHEEQFTLRLQEVSSHGMEQPSYPLINYIGVYEIIDRSIPVSVMCDRATLAISKIKGDYHKRIAHYDEVLRDNIRYETELIRDFNDAITQKQLKMYLQPQVSSDGRMLGAEALVRWEHPVKGLIPPAQFLPVFEKNGLISDVDKYMWETACRQLRDWKEQGREDLYISVNISPRDFYFLNIYQIFTELVEMYEINPRNLKLEITETAIIMDFERQMELISKLRSYGFAVEMDDFGSGNSSLNLLKDIYVDVLKIDMVFLQAAQDEERSRKILQMIISLSKQLNMPVITEGVETLEQVRFLDQLGCDMFQGYYFARPMPVEEFERLYFEQSI